MNNDTMKVKVEKIHPHRGDIVLVLQPKALMDEEFDRVIQGVADTILSLYGYSVLTIGVKSLKDIRVLDEDAMNRYGWYRKPAGTKLEEWLEKLTSGEEE